MFIAIATLSLGAQATDPVLPSAALKPFSHGAPLIVPAADVRSRVEEDSKANAGAMAYDVVQSVNQALIAQGASQQGRWQSLSDGRELWSMQLQSDGAVSLDLHFSRMQLPDQAELYLADAKGSYVLGPIRGSDALADLQYYTALIPGDRVTIEVVVPAPQRGQVDLHLAGVTYGYRGLFGLKDHADVPRAGACNVDVACVQDDVSGPIDAVGQYVFVKNGESYVCTGSLIGNTARTPTPYFITANHCVSSQTVAQSMRVYWNYQSATCRDPGSDASGTPLDRPSTYTNGASLRMTYAPNDTTLVELNAPVPASEHPFFLGWDRRDLATPGNPQIQGAYSIHHPRGHEKRFSLDQHALTVTSYMSNTPTADGSHYRIGHWEEGTTEGGSSGAALLSPDGRLIGTLHGGYAACGNTLPDWYGRIHQSWQGGGANATRLSNWLDPSGTAVNVFDGYRPSTGPGDGEGLFCSSFEAGESGSCGGGSDIVSSPMLNIQLHDSIGTSGFSINWLTGATCYCDDETGYHFSPYAMISAENKLSFWFYPDDEGHPRAGLTRDNKYAVLGSGAVIGPSATFGAFGVHT